MIYLFLHRSIKDYLDYYKVGYTDDLPNRLNQYKAYNPTIEEILSREGGLFEEKLLHEYLHLVLHEPWGFWKSEWYTTPVGYGQEIIKGFFSTDWTVILQEVWNVYSRTGPKGGDPQWWNELRVRALKELPDPFASMSPEIFLSLPEDPWKGILDDLPPEVADLYQYFRDNPDFMLRMKKLCEFVESSPELLDMTEDYPAISEEFYAYVEALGTNRVKGYGCQKSKLNDLMDSILDPDLVEIIQEAFTIGSRIPNPEVKSRLQEIYNKAGLKKKAKAADIQEFFNVCIANFTDKQTGRKYRGYTILSKKQ